MIKLKKHRRRLPSMPEITLTPLIDTALTLLIIFIVTTPIVNNGIKITLPHGKSKEVSKQQEFVVSLSKNGELYFNSFPVKKEDLIKATQEALHGKQDIPIYVRADQTVPYGNVIEVVDTLKQAGVMYVAMATRATA